MFLQASLFEHLLECGDGLLETGTVHEGEAQPHQPARTPGELVPFLDHGLVVGGGQLQRAYPKRAPLEIRDLNRELGQGAPVEDRLNGHRPVPVVAVILVPDAGPLSRTYVDSISSSRVSPRAKRSSQA